MSAYFVYIDKGELRTVYAGRCQPDWIETICRLTKTVFCGASKDGLFFYGGAVWRA